MSPPDKPTDKKAERYGQVQKRRISWEEFEHLTGRKRPVPPGNTEAALEPPPPAAGPVPPAPEPPPPDPAAAFAALMQAVREKPRQKAFGQLIRRRLATMGMTQAKASALVGFKNRGQLGNALDARSRWAEDKLQSLLAVLDGNATSVLEELEHDKE